MIKRIGIMLIAGFALVTQAQAIEAIPETAVKFYYSMPLSSHSQKDNTPTYGFRLDQTNSSSNLYYVNAAGGAATTVTGVNWGLVGVGVVGAAAAIEINKDSDTPACPAISMGVRLAVPPGCPRMAIF